MSLVKIPDIPGLATGLDGSELMELVQGGVSKQVVTGLIAGLASTGVGSSLEFILVSAVPAIPNSRGLAVESGPLTLTDAGAQGDITISVTANGITNAKLAQVADHTVKGNISGSTGSPSDISIAQLVGAIYSPINVTAAGTYNVPLTALTVVINKTDGADVLLPALALKVGSVQIIAAQGLAHPFNVTVTDGTIAGLATYPFVSNYQSAIFGPFVAGNVWTI